MKFLLDTHIFLWFISGDARLSVSLKQIIRNSDNDIYLSVVFDLGSDNQTRIGKIIAT